MNESPVGSDLGFSPSVPLRCCPEPPQALPIPPPGFDELSPEEKLRYVTALWDRIVEQQDALPLSDAHRDLVRERLAAHRANPDAARSWSEARRDIEDLLRQRPSR